MCLATQFQRYKLDPSVQTAAGSPDEQYLQLTVGAFRQRIVQCLILGDYIKGGPHALETLMLYFTVELFLSNDAEPDVWILVGTIIQIAMRMCYHRDPRHFQGMTPFSSEMRRRIWATIVALDLIISAQVGLPRLIKQWQADTMELSNLQDREFGKATKCMPPSRPETDLTPMLFRIVSARILTAMGAVWCQPPCGPQGLSAHNVSQRKYRSQFPEHNNITIHTCSIPSATNMWDFATDTRTYTHDDVMKVDSKLQAAHASIPQCLKWSFAGLANSPQTMMQKMSLDMVFYRAKIVLHRRYLHRSTKAQYTPSRQACLDAALKLLEYQHNLQEKTDIFGQLYHDRWRISSIVKHDFLLASSILCSYLQQAHQTDVGSQAMDITIHSALERTHGIWLRSSSESKEARKAATAFGVVLGIAGSTASGEAHARLETPFATASMSAYADIGSYQGRPSFHDAAINISKLIWASSDIHTDVNMQYQGADATTWTDWCAPAAMDTF
ncbi:hypothetical protein EJ02DRAFT_462340 [Clathrospora elynae]|uniref:Xylanolytic transcriptional activator regulatory domain-containing protein n=1 Tax=Clathrospora elynae TaxID=706981 RepID=A0A6A5T450_9PLEO|nr:hypothetical protein EJ02DRAFT_462340 [Clathrospora elynae]